MSYSSIVMLPTSSSASMELVETKLREAFTGKGHAIDIFRDQEQLTLSIEGWFVYVSADGSETVIEESQGIVELFGSDRSDRAALSTYEFRLDLTSDDDPNLDYFDEYRIVISAMKKLPNAVVFDPDAEEFV